MFLTVINTASNSGSSGIVRMTLMVKRTIAVMSMMSRSCEEKKPGRYRYGHSFSKTLGILESPKTARTVMLLTVVEESRKQSSETEWWWRNGRKTLMKHNDKKSGYKMATKYEARFNSVS